MKIIKGNLYYKNWFFEDISKVLHRKLVPLGYVNMAIDTHLFCFLTIPGQLPKLFIVYSQHGCVHKRISSEQSKMMGEKFTICEDVLCGCPLTIHFFLMDVSLKLHPQSPAFVFSRHFTVPCYLVKV